MLRSLFCKEWLKTRLVVALAWFATMGMILYLLLSLRHTILTSGAVETIATMLGRDLIFVDIMRFVPLIIGVCLALAQWLPEMQQKRLKLTLHLPVHYAYSISIMLLYGVVVMLGISLSNLLLLGAVEAIYLPYEIIRHTLLTMLTWYLAGIMGYLLFSWVILEPIGRMRVFALCISAALLSICYLSSMPEAYNYLLPALLLLTLLLFMLPFYSVYRFKQGKGL